MCDEPNEVDPEAFDFSYVKYEDHSSLMFKAAEHGRESFYLDLMLACGEIKEGG